MTSRFGAVMALLLCLISPCIAEEPTSPNLDFFLVEEVFPHIAIGGPWTTTLTFVNLGSENAQFSLRFFTPNGQPWIVPTSTGVTSSVFTVNIPGLSSLDIELVSPGSAIQTGWAEIDQPTNTTIGGHAVFRDNGGPGRPIPFEAVVPMSDFAEGTTTLADEFRISFMLFDQTRGFNTCIALANPSPSFHTSVAITRLDQVPAQQVGDLIDLGPRQQSSFCLKETFPQLQNQKGVVQIVRPSGDLNLSILGFRFDPQGAFTTFFPMSPL